MNIDVVFSETNQTFAANFGEVQTVTQYVGGGVYEGDYEVIPRTVEQTMPTKEKVMLDDVTVKAIPTYEVSNGAGGQTFYIAKE